VAKLSLQRIPFTREADNRLRMMKARTGITPNIICRIGFCMSLEEPGDPAVPDAKSDPGREINRFTLLGEYDAVFVALLIARLAREENLSDSLDGPFVAHMNRGTEMVAARLKSLGGLSALISATT